MKRDFGTHASGLPSAARIRQPSGSARSPKSDLYDTQAKARFSLSSTPSARPHRPRLIPDSQDPNALVQALVDCCNTAHGARPHRGAQYILPISSAPGVAETDGTCAPRMAYPSRSSTTPGGAATIHTDSLSVSNLDVSIGAGNMLLDITGSWERRALA